MLFFSADKLNFTMAHLNKGQDSIPSLKDLSFQVFYEKVVSRVDYKTSELVWAYVEKYSQGGNITMDIMEPGKGIRYLYHIL